MNVINAHGLAIIGTIALVACSTPEEEVAVLQEEAQAAREPLKVNSVTPDVAHSEDAITVRGRGFGTSQGQVLFGDAAGAVVSWSAKVIRVVVPRHTEPDVELRVSTPDGTSAPVPFTIYDAMTNLDGTPGSATTFVSLTFDDTTADQLAARPALTASGVRATFFVNSSRVGGVAPGVPAYFTLADLLSLQAEGHEIGGHALQHVDLRLLDADEVLRETCGDRARLLEMGLRAQTFAYPFGARTADIASAVESCGYRAARVVDHGSGPWPLPVPPPDRLAITTAVPVVATTTLDDMKRAVERAEQVGGGWVPMVFHRVCSDGCSGLAVRPEVFSAFVEWLAARASIGTVTRTMRQMIPGGVAPSPTGIPTPVPLDGLPNASFEAYSHGTINPDCWLLADTGHELAHWSVVGPGHDAAAAVSLSPGETVRANRRIRLLPVAGCVPRVVTGGRYEFAVWYRSDVPVKMYAMLRDARAFWTSWSSSLEFPASPGDWSRAAWALPDVPAGYDAVNVSVQLPLDGAMVLDDFSFVQR